MFISFKTSPLILNISTNLRYHGTYFLAYWLAYRISKSVILSSLWKPNYYQLRWKWNKWWGTDGAGEANKRHVSLMLKLYLARSKFKALWKQSFPQTTKNLTGIQNPWIPLSSFSFFPGITFNSHLVPLYLLRDEKLWPHIGHPSLWKWNFYFWEVTSVS